MRPLPVTVSLALIFTLLLFGLSGCGDEINSDPFANAGEDQTVQTGSSVQLDGSASYDNEEDILSYVWEVESLPAGSTAALSNTDTATTTFTADVSGVYEFCLMVDDGENNSDEDYVSVTASYSPVANAGVDRTGVDVGTVVQLDGTDSSDPDGDSLTYDWSIDSQPENSSPTLSDSTSSDPTLLMDVEGEYVISLVVSDGYFESAADSVTVTTSGAP
jgi:hypothetical protein